MAEKKSSHSSEDKKSKAEANNKIRKFKVRSRGPKLVEGSEVHMKGLLDPDMPFKDFAHMFGYTSAADKEKLMATLEVLDIHVHITKNPSYPQGFIKVSEIAKWLAVLKWTEEQSRALLTELDPYYGKSEAEKRMLKKEEDRQAALQAAQKVTQDQAQLPPPPPPVILGVPVGELGGATMIVPDDTDNREEANTNVAKRARRDDDDDNDDNDEEGQAAVAIRRALRGLNEAVARLEDELVNIFTESKQKKQKKDQKKK